MNRPEPPRSEKGPASWRPPAAMSPVLNWRQRDRLEWIVSRNGPPQFWNGSASLADESRTVIVLEPPTGPIAERFVQALAPDAIVVIPYGENPVFDPLKSKLVDFGTVGACGAEGPHQLWWGGPSRSGVTGRLDGAAAPRIVARHSQSLRAVKLVHTAAALGLPRDIRAVDIELQTGPVATIDLVLDAWRTSDGPILWVDAGASLRSAPMLPPAIECDFAVHRWKRWEFSPATLYFARTAAAETLLRTWRTLAAMCPDVWEGHLLDQAWSLVSSQIPLGTLWLPDPYHATSESPCAGEEPVVVHEVAAGRPVLAPWPAMPPVLRGARRAGRTGAPEAQMVMASNCGDRGGVTVMVRDVACSSAIATAAAVEAAAGAFAAESGGFSQLELTLCCWEDDVRSIRTASPGQILQITPQVRLAGDSFGQLRDAPPRRLFAVRDHDGDEADCGSLQRA